MQRTLEVWHENRHAPSDEQLKAALGVVLLDEGYKQPTGDVTYRMVVNVSGGPSKVVAEFDEPEKRKGAEPPAEDAKG